MEGAMLPTYTMVDGEEDMVRHAFLLNQKGSASILQTLVTPKSVKDIINIALCLITCGKSLLWRLNTSLIVVINVFYLVFFLNSLL